jgi:hypothetical protein
MSTTLTNNGNSTATQRKTLASQLDRLDSILDALDIGLKEAVATAVEGAVEQAVRQAVEQAVQQAVQGLIAEVLTNADALALLRAALAPEPAPAPPPPPPPPPKRAPSRSGGLGSWLWKRAAQACSAVCNGVRHVAGAAKKALNVARPYKKPLLIAAGVGTGVAVAACLAGPVLAGPAAWVAGFLGTLAVRAGATVRNTLGLSPAAT